MRVVIAPDKFKGSLTATQVAQAVADGLRDRVGDLDVVQVPVADGGDGTVDAAISAGFERVEVDVVGPTGEPVRTSYAAKEHRAVVELADAVGLFRLPDGRLDALGSSTYGLGLVIKDAVERGATEVVIGLGGSASTDGGAGMVQALGASLTDAAGEQIAHSGTALADVDALDLSALRERLAQVSFVVACDVDNPLLGPQGAAAVFGPQKGASPEDVKRLDAALAGWARLVADVTGSDESDRPGAGAAGGAGFAALALLGAELRPGIELVLDLVDFATTVEGADLVITGEGSLDEQSLSGKAPVGVAQAAARAGSDVVAVAGRSLLSAERAAEAGIARVYPLSDLEPDPATSIANAAALLRTVARTIADEWLTTKEDSR